LNAANILNEIIRTVDGMFKEGGCDVGFERNLEDLLGSVSGYQILKIG